MTLKKGKRNSRIESISYAYRNEHCYYYCQYMATYQNYLSPYLNELATLHYTISFSSNLNLL